MLKVVLDTNVLVSALLNPGGKPAQILALIHGGHITLYYDSRIFLEYENVLSRKKFPFEARDRELLLAAISHRGMALVPAPSDMDFSDTQDKKFYEAAAEAGAYLITGNKKHFPDLSWIVTPADFLEEIRK